jgi:ribonuclease R
VGLSDDYYVYDVAACRLVGRRSGRTFALGDAVKVEVQSVSVVRRKVDFALAGHRARYHDDRGDRFGKRGDKRGRGERHGRRDKHQDKHQDKQDQPRHGRRSEGRQDARPGKKRPNIPVSGKNRGERAGGNRRGGKPKKRR